MKNIIIYISPNKNFDKEHASYAEIQIENSLSFWKQEDIILATNFEYEYKGVKSMVVPDEMFCEFDAKASKINVLIYLLENNLLNTVAWFHDMEAFQAAPIEINLHRDLGLTDYGWKEKFNTGSFFFTPNSLDIFYWIKKRVYDESANEEPILWNLYRENYKNIQERCQRLNITYNLGRRHIKHNLSIAEKPVKVFHFHPYREGLLEKFRPHIPDTLYNLINEKSPNIH